MSAWVASANPPIKADLGRSPKAPPAAEHDVPLVSACHAFFSADQALQAYPAVADDDETTVLTDIWFAALRRVTETDASSIAGAALKARAAFLALRSLGAPNLGLEEKAALSALADLIRVTGRMA